MVVINKQELFCGGGDLETDMVRVNSSVVVIVCPVPLLSTIVVV